MIKKSNFLSAQNKENLPECETVTIFTPEEIERFKAEAFSTFKDGKRKYQQAAAYILMLNTGLRTGELLGLLNSDIDLENKTLTVRQGVKEIVNRDGVGKTAGIKQKGLHSLRHTFATNLVNGQKQPDGTIKALSPRQAADLLGHSTSQITELYYVKKDTSRLNGITEGFKI